PATEGGFVMRTLMALFLVVAVAIAFSTGAGAGEKKEVTITGKITCAKCELGKEKSCMTVIVEKKDGKDIVYYFDKASHKKFHNAICTEGKEGSVTGTVGKEGDKNTVMVKKLDYKK